MTRAIVQMISSYTMDWDKHDFVRLIDYENASIQRKRDILAYQMSSYTLECVIMQWGDRRISFVQKQEATRYLKFKLQKQMNA